MAPWNGVESCPASTRPFWCRGGMHLVECNAIFNTLIPVYIFVQPLLESPRMLAGYSAFLVMLSLYAMSSSPSFKVLLEKQMYAGAVLPLYQSTALLVFLLPKVPLVLAVSLFLATVKVGVCMSVCLHRYMAHGAFKCHPVVNFALGWLGCLANQGGPIWWSSQHRTHHKYCDKERDPHSAIQTSMITAFCFFATIKDVEEEFAPHERDNLAMRVLDTFAGIPVTIELLLAYHFFGPLGLFCSYTSAWISQTVSLWFNVANHPPTAHEGEICKAANHYDVEPPNLLLKIVHSLIFIARWTGEDGHGHHHDHANLAQRPGTDMPYYYFVRPLEALGLIWDVRKLKEVKQETAKAQ